MTRKPFAKLEDFLGAIALIVAFFALGVFDFKKEDPLVEAGLQASAKEVVREARHAVAVEVDGRDLTLTGLVDSDEEKARLLNGLRGIDGRGRIKAEVEVLEAASPYRTRLDHPVDGAIVMSGNIPSEALRDRLEKILGHDLSALRLASGAPDGWAEMADLLARAMQHLEEAHVVIEDRRVDVAATALTPLEAGRAERLLGAAPEAYEITLSMDLLDDGSPLRLSARRSVDGDISLAGKLPEGMELEGFDVSQVVRTPVAPPVVGWEEAAATGLEALEALQVGQLSITGRSLTLTGEAWSDTAISEVHELLSEVSEKMILNLGVTQMDDGQPFDLTVQFDGERAKAEGKIPRDLPLRVQAAFLDHPVEDAGLELAQVAASSAWWAAAVTGLEALAHFEHGELRVTEGRLSLTGQAFGPEEMAKIDAALSALPEGVDLVQNVQLRDDGSPASLALHFDGQTVLAEGKMPKSLLLPELARNFGTEIVDDGVAIAYLPVEKGFSAAVKVGVTALSKAENGNLHVANNKAVIRATVRDPKTGERVQEALSKMPLGYELDVDLSYLDDGRPFYLTMEFDGTVAVSGGKVPRDLGVASQTAIFGGDVRAGDLTFAEVLASPEWWGAARAGIVGLSMLERGSLQVDTDVIRLSGLVTDAPQQKTIERRLSYLPEGFSTELSLMVRSESGQATD
ncbi:hypothetical protein FDP25_01375 [Roseovarius sp. A21]|uniref:BON domain-containing protein n=1 Tax=Roseovarius bejariae TaxID=2576383 RepID=A0A844CHC3_9RHOB|nr:hypothetical protein [Roseovarius bejariae]MRU14072.1 hypothetical protein [Roseovarius bejariae]